MINKLSLFLFVLMGLSCQTKTSDKTEKNSVDVNQKVIFPEVNDEFDGFLRNFRRTTLPIKIKGCELGIEGLTEFNGENFSKYVKDYSFSYKQIPTNGNCIATITLGAADCFLPILTTYKLNGEVIDQKTIAIGYCGFDCGYSCEEFMTIKNDFSIYVSDTIISSECDSLGNIIPNTTENYVIYKTGKLLKSGEIELSDEIKKELKK